MNDDKYVNLKFPSYFELGSITNFKGWCYVPLKYIGNFEFVDRSGGLVAPWFANEHYDYIDLDKCYVMLLHINTNDVFPPQVVRAVYNITDKKFIRYKNEY